MKRKRGLHTQPMIALIVFIAICLFVGVSGSAVTATAVQDWYPQIEKPSWTPPDALFGPVWSVLYLLMGVSAWLAWRDSTEGKRRGALTIFAIQLALNALWSIIFFGLQNPGLAALEIVLLWGAIVATILVFYRINRIAAGLLVPYLAWVSFAAALNIEIWNLNG